MGYQGAHQSTTSLPSISQLYPYPQSFDVPQGLPIYDSSPGYPNPPQHMPPPTGSPHAVGFENERSQPYTPCTCRGEQGGYQWQVIEPIFHSEKYVTKAEFDELKWQFNQLAVLVQRPLPTAPGSQYYPMPAPPISLSEAVGEAVPSYSGPGISAPMSMAWESMMGPPQPPLPQQPSYPLDPLSQPYDHYVQPESPAHLPRLGLPTTATVAFSHQHPSSLPHGVHQLESSPTQSTAAPPHPPKVLHSPLP